MSVCKERPAALPPLDSIGLKPVDRTQAMSRGGSGLRPSGTGLGFTPSALGKPGANNLFNVSEERYASSYRAASVSGAPGMQYTSNWSSTMQGTASASQGSAGVPLQKRVRTKRKGNRNENIPGGPGGDGHGSGFNNDMHQMQTPDSVAPLQGWVPHKAQKPVTFPPIIAQMRESYHRQISMSQGGGGDHGEFNNRQQVEPNGWAGDLSNFGKISKTQHLRFGTSSVFAGKGAKNKREEISRTNSNLSMFSMLSSQGVEAGDKGKFK